MSVRQQSVLTTPRPPVRAPQPASAPQGEEAYRFSGHSGAQLVLLRRGRRHVVRKTSASPAQNARLLAQAEQQRQFFFSGIPVPRILETGTNEAALAYFEMEYVPGQTVANIVAEAMPLDPAPVEDALTRLFDFLHLTASGTIPVMAFIAKIEQIAACESEVCRVHHAEIARAATRLSRLDWSGIPQSAGHGDLTLENIMVSPERGVVFIDCDECFSSSYWLDAGKLFQDVAGHWCLRALYRHNGPALVNAVQQIKVLKAPLLRLAGKIDSALPNRLSQLAALHLFRTLPYIHEAAVAGFVLKRLEMVLSS
jgi:aminoglycoside phosphotransferase